MRITLMHKKELQRFAKVLDFVLGVRPDEFGLVPDPEGYVTFKELLQALREEPDWSFIGRGHLMELMHSQGRDRFDYHEERIRATVPKFSPTPDPWDPPPHLLYHAVRRRAHPVVMRHGLKPNKGPWVIMAVTEELALRMGKRRDPEPVVLEIKAQEAARKGGRFFQTQGLIALAWTVPPEFVHGPPVAVDETPSPPPKPKAKSEKAMELPGSFFLDLQDPPFGTGEGKDRSKPSRRREKGRFKREEKGRRRG
jgi:putative RNA 2'-phosphotransferase